MTSYTVTFDQVGLDVVATGSGSINLSGLTFWFSGHTDAFVQADNAIIFMGPTAAYSAHVNIYIGPIVGPATLGISSTQYPNSNVGDINFVGIDGSFPNLFVPYDYVSGTPLLSSDTWYGTTLADIGVPPGIYDWTWGSGCSTNQCFELNVPNFDQTAFGGPGPTVGSGLGGFLLPFLLLMVWTNQKRRMDGR